MIRKVQLPCRAEHPVATGAKVHLHRHSLVKLSARGRVASFSKRGFAQRRLNLVRMACQHIPLQTLQLKTVVHKASGGKASHLQHGRDAHCGLNCGFLAFTRQVVEDLRRCRTERNQRNARALVAL